METKFNKYSNIEEKLKQLKNYIYILKNSENDINDDIMINYFIIIHNFLLIERMFSDEVIMSNKELNKYLELEPLNNADDTRKKFFELYDNNHKVKFAIETFDSIESIRTYLSKQPEIHTKLLKK